MQPALLIRLRPLGPWRYGPGDGGQNRVDTLFRSDRVFSAVTLAMRDLGFLEEWLDATARNAKPAVSFSSLLPYQADTLFAPPPATLWPPPSASVSTSSPVFLTKVRWTAARFVPLSVVESILTGGAILADQWVADPESGCLLRRDRPNTSPFRVAVRSSAAVDRLSHSRVHVDAYACAEFEASSGLWAVARFADAAAESAWNDRLRGVFRLLADRGFGGRRTSGWGQTEGPGFQSGAWPSVLSPKLGRIYRNGAQAAQGYASQAAEIGSDPSLYWLLSLYSPSSADSIDWTAGQYEPTVRGGRIESTFGSGLEKKPVRMISEGSVLAARSEPIGAAVDVAPEGFAHPVYRSGLALALKLPALEERVLEGPVEMPSEPDLEQRPCEEPAEQRSERGRQREDESVTEQPIPEGPGTAEEEPTG
ncbi:MAG: type III-A CRISPR-associated RAMP protein Csm4 [Bryobacteraceae bacterium]